MFARLREKLYWQFKTCQISASKYTERGLMMGRMISASPFLALNSWIESTDPAGRFLLSRFLIAHFTLFARIFSLPGALVGIVIGNIYGHLHGLNKIRKRQYISNSDRDFLVTRFLNEPNTEIAKREIPQKLFTKKDQAEIVETILKDPRLHNPKGSTARLVQTLTNSIWIETKTKTLGRYLKFSEKLPAAPHGFNERNGSEPYMAIVEAIQNKIEEKQESVKVAAKASIGTRLFNQWKELNKKIHSFKRHCFFAGSKSAKPIISPVTETETTPLLAPVEPRKKAPPGLTVPKENNIIAFKFQ